MLCIHIDFYTWKIQSSFHKIELFLEQERKRNTCKKVERQPNAGGLLWLKLKFIQKVRRKEKKNVKTWDVLVFENQFVAKQGK